MSLSIPEDRTLRSRSRSTDDSAPPTLQSMVDDDDSTSLRSSPLRKPSDAKPPPNLHRLILTSSCDVDTESPPKLIRCSTSAIFPSDADSSPPMLRKNSTDATNVAMRRTLRSRSRDFSPALSSQKPGKPDLKPDKPDLMCKTSNSTSNLMRKSSEVQLLMRDAPFEMTVDKIDTKLPRNMRSKGGIGNHANREKSQESEGLSNQASKLEEDDKPLAKFRVGSAKLTKSKVGKTIKNTKIKQKKVQKKSILRLKINKATKALKHNITNSRKRPPKIEQTKGSIEMTMQQDGNERPSCTSMNKNSCSNTVPQCLCIRPPICPLHPHIQPTHQAPPPYVCTQPYAAGQSTQPTGGHWPEPFIIPGNAMGQVMQGMGMPSHIPGAYYFPHFLAIPLPHAGSLPAGQNPWTQSCAHNNNNNNNNNNSTNEKQAKHAKDEVTVNKPVDNLEDSASETPPPILRKYKKRKADECLHVEMSLGKPIGKRRKCEQTNIAQCPQLIANQQFDNVNTPKPHSLNNSTPSPLTIKIQRAVDSKGQPTLRVSPNSEAPKPIGDRLPPIPTPPPILVAQKKRNRSQNKQSLTSNWKPLGEPIKKWVYVGNKWKPIRVNCYKSIQHKLGIETLHERDAVLVLSQDKKLPDIAKIATFFEDPHDRTLWASVLWYYRPESLDISSLGLRMNAQELLASRHVDRIPVDSIQDVCYVITPNEYARFKAENRLDARPIKWTEREICSRGSENYPRRRLQPTEDTTEDAVFFVRHCYDFPKKSLWSNIRRNYQWVPFLSL